MTYSAMRENIHVYSLSRRSSTNTRRPTHAQACDHSHNVGDSTGTIQRKVYLGRQLTQIRDLLSDMGIVSPDGVGSSKFAR